ncbi:MAG TPA: hypothetical protein VLA48_03245 [Nitrososphaeraceae archaeon]|nr:hypothetical protein [Nitrososphaeraceae archaeon]
MTTVDQVKDRFLVKSEKNGTNDNIAVDNLIFSLLYNESQNKYLTLQLQQRGVDDVRYIQKFLILDKKISYSSKLYNKENYPLPPDYFDLAAVRGKAKKENCSHWMHLVEVKTENVEEVLQDEYSKPSFEWEEALYTVNADNLSIYTDGTFTMSDVLLNYYRYPSQIRLIDEQDPESKFTSNSLIEWDDKALDDIITLMVFNLDINENNPRFQLQTIRAQK